MAFPNNPTSPPVLELNSHAINTSCVGFWPLTQVSGTVATDISTGGNDGTAGGNPGWVSETIGNAATFDGAGDYFEFTNSQSQSGLTLSAWCKFETTWTLNSHILSVADETTTDYTSIGWKNAGGTMYLMARQVDGTANDAIESSSSNDGNWHHVVGVFNGTTQVLYIDGVQAATNSGATSLTTTTRGRIGMAADSTPIQEFNGNIQNARVFNTALSASDVALLYNRPWVGTDYDETFPYSPPVPSGMSLSTDTAATGLNSGCVGWWPLTETSGTVATDISTGGNNATAIGTLSHVSTARGNAMDFDGATNGLEVAYDASQQPSVITVSCWFKADDLSTDMKLASKTESGGWQFGFNSPGDTGNLSFLVRVGGAYYYASKATTGLSIGQWYHAVGTYDGSNVKLYIDSVLEDTTAISGTILYAHNNSLGISSEPGTGSGNDASLGFDGNIQNVRIWDRALTADEITLLYERPWEGESTYGDLDPYDPPPTLALKAGEAINTDCVGWWPLLEEDDYASGAADISGNGNNGTQSGGVLSAYSPLGGVASFDGVDDRFDLTTLSGFDAYTNATTVSMWCYLKDDSVQQYFFNKHNSANSGANLFAWTPTPTNGDLEFKLHDLSNTTAVSKKFSGLATQILNKWTHLVFVSEGSDFTLSSNLEVYVDGVVRTATSSVNGDGFNSSEESGGILSLGGRYYDNTRNMYADFQNVRIWSRALSAAEVQSLYETPWIGSNYPTVAEIFNYIYRSKRFRRL